MDDPQFAQTDLTAEDAFWVMWYFLEENYQLSNGTFDVSDILSASELVPIAATGQLVPADNGMISFWNEALEKYRQQGLPPRKTFRPE